MSKTFTKEEITNEVINIVSKISCVDTNEIKEESILGTGLGLDSLDKVELLMELELKFSIIITVEDEENWETVKDVIEVVEKYL